MTELYNPRDENHPDKLDAIDKYLLEQSGGGRRLGELMSVALKRSLMQRLRSIMIPVI